MSIVDELNSSIKEATHSDQKLAKRISQQTKGLASLRLTTVSKLLALWVFRALLPVIVE